MDNNTRQSLVRLVKEMRETAATLERCSQTARMSELDSWMMVGKSRGYEAAADMIEDLLLEDQDDD